MPERLPKKRVTAMSEWAAVDADRGPLQGTIIVLTLEIVRDGDQWIGRCLELGPATFGDTAESARSQLIKLVELHLNALERAGKREDAFRERHVAVLNEIPQTLARGNQLKNKRDAKQFKQPFERQAA